MDKAMKTLYDFNPRTSEISEFNISELNFNKIGSMTVQGQGAKFFITGGVAKESLICKQLYNFDSTTGTYQLRILPSLLKKRTFHSMCALGNDSIIVTGGTD